MSFAAVLILAVSLSMDALGIGISYGLRGIRVSWKARVVICAMSMMVTGAAVGLGSVLLEVIPLPAAKLLGCGMLLILGLVIIGNERRKTPSPAILTVLRPLKPPRPFIWGRRFLWTPSAQEFPAPFPA